MSKTWSMVWACAGIGLVAALAGCVEGEIGDDAHAPTPTFHGPNSISTLAITNNAFINPEAMSELTSHSLRSLETGPGPAAYLALSNPRPRTLEFVKYLASCALPAGQSIKVNGTYYYGDFGLAPGWATGPSTVKEQECVSACLLARNNALGKRVIVSMLSNGCGLPAAATVRTMAQEPATGAAIASLGGCSIWDSFSTSPLTNCGWKADYVVTGTRATSDTVTAPPSTFIRVCEGVAGCDNPSPRLLAAGTNSVTLTYPANGVISVMVKDTHAGWGTLATASHTNSTSQAEVDIWRWREAAFYGNLFTTNMTLLTRHLASGVNEVRDLKGALVCTDKAGGEDDLLSCPSLHGTVFPSMYVVSSSVWRDWSGKMKERVCGGPSKDLCAAVPLGMASAFCEVPDFQAGHPVDVDYFDFCRNPAGIKNPRAITTRLLDADRCTLGASCSVD